MISPYIKWNHSEDWFVPKFDSKGSCDRKVEISLADTDYKYIEGHVIDGKIISCILLFHNDLTIFRS